MPRSLSLFEPLNLADKICDQHGRSAVEILLQQQSEDEAKQTNPRTVRNLLFRKFIQLARDISLSRKQFIRFGTPMQ